MKLTGYLVCSLVLIFASHSALAVTIWSTSSSVSGNEADQLINYDSASPGAVTVVGSTGVAENFIFRGLDYDAAETLYGYTVDRQTFEAGGLYSIDTGSGLATFIGGGGVDTGGGLVDISYNPFDGKMYGLQLRGFAQNRATILYTIDLNSGLATKVGEVSPFGFFPGGLATNAAGTQFVFNAGDDYVWELAGLNATQLSNPTGFMSLTGNGFAIDWSRGGAMFLNGIENFFPGGGVLPEAQFWTVDSATGLGTKVGTIGDGQVYRTWTLAIAPATTPATVSEPASFALIGLGLAGIGLWRTRRTQVAIAKP